MADERITLRRATVEALAEMLDNEAQGYARVTQARNIARLLREDAGERFYPEPPKPAPERIGSVAKRVRAALVLRGHLVADIERLLACAEASDEHERDTGDHVKSFGAWRRTVTGEP